MWAFLRSLIAYNDTLLNKVKASQIYDEALALHSAKESKKAFPLMLQAAELGHPAAMSILGSMYLLGTGTKEDGSAAVKWLKKSIEAGFEDADSILGMAYATGKAGVKIDEPKARVLLEAAAQRGDQQSIQMLGMMDRGEGMFAKKKTKNQKLH